MEGKKYPSHRIVAKDRNTGKYVDIGVLFESEYGYNVALEEGVTVKVTRSYDKEARGKVALAEPVYVTKTSHFVNANKPREEQSSRVNPLKEKIKDTFGLDDQDLPF